MHMVDIECMIYGLKAAWIPRLIQSDRYASCFNEQLKKSKVSLKMLIDGKIIKESQFNADMKISQFYSDCITSFNMCNETPSKPTNSHNFLSQPIWCNTLFMSKGKTLLSKNLSSCGFKWVKDLYNDKGEFLSVQEIYERLKDRRNWIVEASLVKNV